LLVFPSSGVLAAGNEPQGKAPTMKVVDDTKENELTLEILHEDEVINVEMVKENESVIKVNTKTNKGEKHTFVYNKNQNFYIFDGKKAELEIEEYYDENDANPEGLTGASDSGMISTMATYDPVYLGTYKFTFSNQADSLSGLVTVIGGVLAAAYLF
jgi:hypothetical protein